MDEPLPSGDSPASKSSKEIPQEIVELSESKPIIRIRNIHNELTETDLSELLSQIGDVKFVKFDETNSSVAYGCFTDNQEQCNHQAINKFNGKKAMGKILVVEDPRGLKDRIGFGKSRGVRNRGPRNARNRGGRERVRKPQKPKRSAEDLDKELEAYMQQN